MLNHETSRPSMTSQYFRQFLTPTSHSHTFMKYCLFAVVTQSFTSSSSSRDFIYGRPLRFLNIKLYLQSKLREIIFQQKKQLQNGRRED